MNTRNNFSIDLETLDDAVHQAKVMASAYQYIHSGQMLPPFDDRVPF